MIVHVRSQALISHFTKEHTVTDANDILMGGGAAGAKFETIGDTVTGTVTREPEARQQKDFRTGTPETWKDGSPKMQVVVQLATDLRDPERPEDDGTRMVYIKGRHLTDAVRSAVRAARANGIHTGGRLSVTYIGDGQAENGLNPPKLYTARYEPPAASFNGVAAPATQQAPAQQLAQPVAQTQPAAVQQQMLANPGIDQATWDRMDPAQQQRVAAAMGANVGAAAGGFSNQPTF
jgi:hypothetical protein